MLSLKTGLSWLVGFMLVLSFFVNIAVQVLHAGPRVRAEAGNNITLVREYILKISGTIPETDDPVKTLKSLVTSLGKLRHVDVRFISNDISAGDLFPTTLSENSSSVPQWFTNLINVDPKFIVIPLIIRGIRYGSAIVYSKPLDELEEIWGDINSMASVSLMMLIPLLISLLLALRILLSPFDSLLVNLTELQAGKWSARAFPKGASEFRSIANAFNHLAESMETNNSEKSYLVNQLIELQESERRELARDLHDDAGPCLFSIRAAALALQDEALLRDANADKRNKLASTINNSSNALQAVIRGILNRVKPQGLEEMGLEAAIKSLISSWRVAHSNVFIELDVLDNLTGLGRPISIAAFRVIQESITNIYRHSFASLGRVTLSINITKLYVGDQNIVEASPVLMIVVEDNGVGLPAKPHRGIGLLGMRERVEALGGKFEVTSSDAAGTRVLACIPIKDNGEA